MARKHPLSDENAKRLEHLAIDAHRVLTTDVAQAKQLVHLSRQIANHDSPLSEDDLYARTEETITSILASVHIFRRLSRECSNIRKHRPKLNGNEPDA